MKVIFVTREGYNLPGARIRGYGFARELAKKGLETEVLSYADTLGAKDGVHEGSMGLAEKIRHNIAAYKRLAGEKDAVIILQRVNYHSFGPLLNRIIKKNRLVLDMDDWEIREDPKYLFGFYPTSKAEYLTRRIAGMAEFCIAGSRYLTDYLRRFNKKTYYIPSCVDTEKFCPNGVEKDKESIKFCWIGTLHRRDDVENVKFAIDCFRELKLDSPDLSLDIIGDGIYRVEIEQYILNNNPSRKVNFIGWIHPDRVPEYLDRIDVGLFPLIQDTKFNLSKSPTKLFEYMAMGKPTVSCRRGEAVYVIEDGKEGFLAENRDIFIDKMKALAEDKGLRKEIGEKAREKIIRDYSLKIAADNLFNAIK